MFLGGESSIANLSFISLIRSVSHIHGCRNVHKNLWLYDAFIIQYHRIAMLLVMQYSYHNCSGYCSGYSTTVIEPIPLVLEFLISVNSKKIKFTAF